MGVVYSWTLFRHFRINIFDYAETNDFLLAAFKDPTVFTMSVISVLIAIGGGLLFTIFFTQPGLPTWAARTARISIITFVPTAFLYTLFIPYLFAGINADALVSPPEDEPLTSVQYRATSRSNEQTTETGLRVIGTTQSFVFFYDRKDTRTLIIPSAQIVEMEHDGPPREKAD